MKTSVIDAIYKDGALYLSEDPGLAEGEACRVTILRTPAAITEGVAPIAATAGAWKGLVDCEKLKADIRRWRDEAPQRPPVKL